MFIETDIRRPSVLAQLEMKDDTDKRIGFSDIISGEASLKESIFNLPGTDLEIISSGKKRTDFTDITNEQKLKQFFKLLAHHYDYVIIDTPPIQPVSDTLLLAQCVDHVYLIARSQYTKMLGVRSTVKKLASLNIELDGIILNSMDTTKSNYYGYNYYYGGYYNKGYSYSTE
jgi:polysaccharide biosynthesis transport protein